MTTPSTAIVVDVVADIVGITVAIGAVVVVELLFSCGGKISGGVCRSVTLL